MTVTIACTTWLPDHVRTSALMRTLASWREHIRSSQQINLIVWDDYSGDRFSKLADRYPTGWWDHGDMSFVSSSEPRGVGYSLNQGITVGLQNGDHILHAVDDWELQYDINLDPWLGLLEENDSIGMIRLGPPHPNLHGSVEHHMDDRWTLNLNPYSYAFATRPFLAHRRWFGALGAFREDATAIEVERDMSDRWNNLRMSAILTQVSRSADHRGFAGAVCPEIHLALLTPFHHLGVGTYSETNPRSR